MVKTLKLVNDVANRGMLWMEEYKDFLTKESEQQNLITQCAGDTRKRYPDFKKSILLKVKRYKPTRQAIALMLSLFFFLMFL